MDLKEAWKKLEQEKLNLPVLGAARVRKTSKHPVQKLIHLFKVTLGFSIFFGLFFGYLLLIMDQPIVKVFLVIMIISYLFFFVINYRILRNIQHSFRLDLNLKSTLKQVFDNTMSTLTFQRKASIILYPLAATAGFLIGLAEERDAATLMQKWQVILALAIAIIILTPSCYLLARWMEKVSYGKYLNQLRELIQQFEKDEPESV
jgi:ABC-type bacteriocin/lantibiotic exporter with double-glycine peptidase domain